MTRFVNCEWSYSKARWNSKIPWIVWTPVRYSSEDVVVTGIRTPTFQLVSSGIGHHAVLTAFGFFSPSYAQVCLADRIKPLEELKALPATRLSLIHGVHIHQNGRPTALLSNSRYLKDKVYKHNRWSWLVRAVSEPTLLASQALGHVVGDWSSGYCDCC